MGQGAQRIAPGFGLARIRDPIEAGFERFGRVLYRNAWKVIAVFVLLVAALATQLPKLRVDTSTEGLLKPHDPVRVAYDDFRERFGQDRAVLLAVETDDVFEIGFLERLRAFHEDIEDEVDNLQEVTSLVNARDTRGEGDSLLVGDLLDPFPDSAEALAAVRARVLENPLYEDQLVSSDGRFAVVVVLPSAWSAYQDDEEALAGFEDGDSGFDDAGDDGAGSGPARLTGEENTAIVSALEEVADRHRSDDFRVYMAGMPIMNDFFMRAMGQDLARFAALALATISLALALLFRRVAAVVIPLVVSVLAMVATVSVMAMLDIPMTSIMQIIPSFLLGVGVGGAVHLLVVFYQAADEGQAKEDALAHSLGHSGLAVVMTSLTTAGGLASFISADIAPIVDLGIVTPIGILSSLLLTILLVPALVAIFPMRPPARAGNSRLGVTRTVLARFGDYATRHAGGVVAAWALLLVVAAAGAARLELAHDPLRWFAEDHPLRVATELMNDELGGVMFLEAVVDTGRDDAFRRPETLRDLERMHAFAERARVNGIRVNKSTSLVDVARETHRALNEDRADFYVIPDDPDLLSQELLLFESSGADEIEKLVDARFSEARLTMKLPFVDAIDYEAFISKLDEGFGGIVDGRASVDLTGEIRVIVRVMHAIVTSLVRTYLLAFLIIAPLMILLLGSLRVGLLSMIPNLAPVLLILGVMGWSGIRLEMFTLMIGSIALGLAVDDTIHFMHNYRRYYEHSGDVRYAVRQTLTTTGQALLFTTIVLSCGFFIYSAASLNNLVTFGVLTGLTIIFAFLADLLLAPALMALLARRMTAPGATATSSNAD